jgi:2-iminobutanoate/2-iminopropanoate deaminase
MRAQHINVEGLAKLPAFCHAVVAGDFIYVSGTLGTAPGSMDLVAGGAGPQTAQAMRNIEQILRGCGAELSDLIKVNVYLAEIDTFAEMNAAYLSVMGDDPPARITVGRCAFALGAAVEIDGVAYRPRA